MHLDMARAWLRAALGSRRRTRGEHRNAGQAGANEFDCPVRAAGGGGNGAAPRKGSRPASERTHAVGTWLDGSSCHAGACVPHVTRRWARLAANDSNCGVHGCGSDRCAAQPAAHCVGAAGRARQRAWAWGGGRQCGGRCRRGLAALRKQRAGAPWELAPNCRPSAPPLAGAAARPKTTRLKSASTRCGSRARTPSSPGPTSCRSLLTCSRPSGTLPDRPALNTRRSSKLSLPSSRRRCARPPFAPPPGAARLCRPSHTAQPHAPGRSAAGAGTRAGMRWA